ncbi:ea4ebcd1-c763-4e88-82b6-e90ff19731a1 [Thermothielavioides terrestris]|uniref:Mitochondrial genome maintenance protein MGM101 n=1 Tax=Thermothielavioides terrestris TaxID=2587410 RepID=A0A3S4AZ14_9PEZI|nr:ea4ebcd1-c763-4e88-82b6-e90ff19731a1 [Thermothielavioides terrestris]
MGSSPSREDSQPKEQQQQAPAVESDDEPDEWDKRIFSTGCADENAKLNDCYYEKKDWRACRDEAAVLPAATVADVDPALAAEIPTSDSPNSGLATSAFTAALSGGGGGNNGTGTDAGGATIDWSSSFHGLSTTPFSPETAAVLMQPLDPLDIEIKPDGIIYLPEIKYRRILNKAFGPGGWGLAPRGELVVGEKVVTREFALVVHGRFIAQARGECQYFSEETIPTAGEGCKSNALLRCCKDLGIASELWDPRFIRDFKRTQCHEVWVEHVVTKKRRQIWTRKDTEPGHPYQAIKTGAGRV